MATHSCILAWKIPWTEEPSRLQSKGSKRVAHDGAHVHTHTTTHIFIYIYTHTYLHLYIYIHYMYVCVYTYLLSIYCVQSTEGDIQMVFCPQGMCNIEQGRL